MGGTGIGTRVERVEDPELLRGQGRYVGDLVGDAARAVFVRSSEAHARITGVDVAAAAAAPGVLAVLTASDLDVGPLRGHAALDDTFDRPCLADEVVRFVGEPVAVVVAATAAAAVDAAELVVVQTEALPAVVDPEAALAADAELLFPDHGTNLAFSGRYGTTDDPVADAEVVVRLSTTNQRVASAPMEPDGVLAVPRPPGAHQLPAVTLFASTQRVHQVRDAVARSLGLDPGEVRVVAPRVGGGFGGKFECSPEAVVVAAAALRLGQAVGWVQTRSENLLTMPHGRGQRQEVALGLRRDGTFVGLDVSVLADAGAYPMVGAVIPNATALMAPGPYRWAKVRAEGRAACTTTTPVGAYRGAGRPEATALVERAVDLAARRLGVDPVDLRRRNLLHPDELDRPSPTGMLYDSGDYERCLDAALAAVDADGVRAEQAARRSTGATVELGLGVAVWMDCTPMNRPGEHAAVALRVEDSAVVADVRDGANDQGQAHATTWGLLLAEVTGLPIGAVRLAGGDTAAVPTGEGTGSARSLMLAGGAVHAAAGKVLDQARAVAGHLLEAAPADIVVTDDGALGVVGSPDRSVSWVEVVGAVEAADGLPREVSGALGPGGRLGATVDFTQPGPTFPSGAHVAVVEVDTETGRVALRRFVAVDDCGTVVNPVVVEGQQHGGIVQGVAQALFEQVVHDADGLPLTTTFADYGIPSAAEVPSIDARTAPTRSPVNALGTKGIGQAGAIGSTAAVQNAVVDALARRGVDHVDLPLTPERVWRALLAASNIQ